MPMIASGASAEKEGNTTAEFSLDYALMTKDGQLGSKEDICDAASLAGAAPVIAGYDPKKRTVGTSRGTQRGR